MDARVSRLSITAIKGFGIREVPEIDLRRTGAVGDRDYFLVDEDDKLLSVTRSAAFVPYWALAQPDGGLRIGRSDRVLLETQTQLGASLRAHFFLDRYVEGRIVEGPWAVFLSEVAGHPVRLVRADVPSGGYDVYPASLLSEASVAALGEEIDGTTLDVRRFRLLITVSGPDPFEEDTWTGRVIRVGGSTLEVGGPIQRCAAIQRHPADGARGVNALRLINQVRGPATSEFGRGLNLGVYGQVVDEGVVRVGDVVSSA